MGNQPLRECAVCQQPLRKQNQCQFCKSKVCQRCYDYPILRVPENMTNADIGKLKYETGCSKCFKAKVTLDLTRNYDVIGQENEKQIVFLHGASSSRAMFVPQARDLAKRGYRSILVDLPGHGSRMDEALTIQNCEKAVKEAVGLCRSKDVTIMGGSLGGYILMLLLGRCPDLCNQAGIFMCGQDVGVRRGVKASIGLFFMGKSASMLSQVTMANLFMSAMKNKHLDKGMIGEMLGTGCYFKHAQENIKLLKEGDYRQCLQKVKGKVRVLFINGEEDFRDSAEIWLEAVGKETSKLITYEKGDHFFSHDTRFYQRFIDDIDEFISK